MADTLEIFGTEYTGVTGIIAKDNSDADLTYIRPQGSLSITANGTQDVASYASVNVNVPSGSPTLQTKSVTYTPTESQQTATITADSGYDGLDEVNVTVNAIPAEYITTTDADATAADVASGKTAYVNGSKITGTLSFVDYYTGSSDPSSSTGSDGDIYLKVVS